jgi:hypothetical protein
MNVPLLARDPADLLQNTEFLWMIGALVATLLVGAFILSRIERWRKRQLSDSPASDVAQFSSYRAMYENGELSKEEYDKIKAKEAQRLRNKVAPRTSIVIPAQIELPANPSPPPTEPPPPSG